MMRNVRARAEWVRREVSNGRTPVGVVSCDQCGREHTARYSHEGQFGGPVFEVVCPIDDVTDFYTLESGIIPVEG